MGATVTWVYLLRGSLQGVRGSTEAWLLAHVQRIHWFDGDFAAAVATSRIPNTFANPLYPWLVGLFSHDVESTMATAHLLSAASLGVIALALWGLWRDAVGPWAALGALAGAAFPAVVGISTQARYDAPALAFALLAAWAASSAWRAPSRRRSLAWPLAGLFVALAYLTREYVGVVALCGLAVALLAGWRAWRGPVVALVVLLAVTLLFSLYVELSPLAGILALVHYAEQHGISRPMLHEILGPPGRRVLMGVGLVGWVLAAWRTPGDRRALLVPVALLVPLACFPFYPQQSPQYYVLLPVVLGSGIGGLVAVLPKLPALARGALGLGVVAALVAWSHTAVPKAQAAPGSVPNLHVESFGRVHELPPLFDWAEELADDRMLVFCSNWVENIDAHAQLHLERPVAFAFVTQLAQVDEALSVADGRDALLVVVERVEDIEARSRGLGEVAGEFELGWTGARAFVLEGKPAMRGPDLCRGRFGLRGFCSQRDYLNGGWAEVARGGAAQRGVWGSTLVFKQDQSRR